MEAEAADLSLAIARIREGQARGADPIVGRHAVRMENGEPHVARVDRDEADGCTVVYFSLENRSYFLAVRVDPTPEPHVRGVSLDAGTEAYLLCYSTARPLSDLLSATVLQPTEQWDMDAGGGSSGLTIKPPLPLADSVDDNVNGLLAVLEQDAAGVKQLSAIGNAFVQVHWYGYGPAMPRLALKAATLARLASLGLALDLDLYAAD